MVHSKSYGQPVGGMGEDHWINRSKEVCCTVDQNYTNLSTKAELIEDLE